MPKINHNDGQYGLDCYLREPTEDDEPFSTEYADDRLALEERARTLITAGRFRYLELQRFNAEENDWEVLQTYEPN